MRDRNELDRKRTELDAAAEGTTVTGILGGLRSEAHLASNRAALNLVA